MQTNVIVKLAIDGLHCWPDARKIFPEVGFLSDIHRHMFHVTLKKKVNHDDRDTEFLMFKRDVMDYLNTRYYRSDYRSHYFGAKSCEMIARELLEKFECEYVSVFEDDENGSEIYLT